MDLEANSEQQKTLLIANDLDDEEWTIINQEINSPRALSRLLKESQRNQCVSPETDEDCMSPPPETRSSFTDDVLRDPAGSELDILERNIILQRELSMETEDEIRFLRSENAELRLVVAQLRSFIATIQKDKQRQGTLSPESTIYSGDEEERQSSAHSLRNDLLKIFSRRRSRTNPSKMDSVF